MEENKDVEVSASEEVVEATPTIEEEVAADEAEEAVEEDKPAV